MTTTIAPTIHDTAESYVLARLNDLVPRMVAYHDPDWHKLAGNYRFESPGPWKARVCCAIDGEEFQAETAYAGTACEHIEAAADILGHAIAHAIPEGLKRHTKVFSPN